jgi:hypothetical protein
MSPKPKKIKIVVGEIFQVAFNTPPIIRLKARPQAALCPQSTRWLGNRIWLRAFPQPVSDSSRQIPQENDIMYEIIGVRVSFFKLLTFNKIICQVFAIMR